MHVHCPHWLMSTDLLSLNAFCRPCKSTTGEMAPKEGSRLAVGTWYGSHWSVHVCLGLVVEYWPFVGACTRHRYSKFYYLCLISSLIKLLPPPTPPRTPPTHPLIYTGPILMNSIKKIIRNWQKPAIVYLSG